MGYRDVVESRVIITSAAAPSTNTSGTVRPPNIPYTIQLSVLTTGTSIVSASCVWEGSNDNLNWVPISSATILATAASTASVGASAGINVQNVNYAYGRARQPAITGTGNASVWMGS